jgi:serine/threonine protein kinase
VKPDRWQKLKEIFDEAVEMDASHRAVFLEKACQDDADLKREAEALLERHVSDSFLEKTASHAYPELFKSNLQSLPPGEKLGSYTITGKIGQGGMGIVYLAHDSRLDRQVAIKMLSSDFLKDPQHRERLRREARAAAKLSHPGIATIYSLEESGDNIYIISEYVKGWTLRQAMTGDPMSLETLLDIAIQTARAISEAHGYGIVHRDLKPENIMWTENGSVKILDFGLARIDSRYSGTDDTRLTRSGMFLGTPAYASPEQLLGSEVDFHTDIFSFGVLLYEMAAGRHPFGAGESIATIARILESDAPGLMAERPSIPEKLDSIVRRCLQKHPEDRYSSMQILLNDLESLSDAQATKPELSSVSPGKETPKRSRLHPLWWWQFHQAFYGFGYYCMLYPQWIVKKSIGGIEGSLLFFSLLIAVGIAANLRLHLWFTSRFYVSELAGQRRKVWKWIRFGDCLFVCILAISAVRIHTTHAIWATLLMAASIGSLVAFSLIEPTTARAALDKKMN